MIGKERREQDASPLCWYKPLRIMVVLLVLAGLWACSGATRWEDDQPISEVSVPESSAPGPRESPRTPVTSTPQRTVTSLLNDFYANWRGTPYRFGGTGREGIDCSALTQKAMSGALGIALPRTTTLQLKQGVAVSQDSVRPGDLVFFKTGETLNHVGVMMGPAKFMHASTRNGVTLSRIDDTYWSSRVIGFRRVIK